MQERNSGAVQAETAPKATAAETAEASKAVALKAADASTDGSRRLALQS